MNRFEEFSSTYQILEKLGEGSGGVVYLAYHKRLQKEVVLKQIKSKGLSMADKRQEVDILKNLNHSFLPQVLDFLTMGDEVYTVMSYIPGKSLSRLQREGAVFNLGQLTRWGMQICSALNYLHSQKPPVIHGDIKPSNIMLTPQGNICLIDFNISFFLDENAVLGYTDGYTSPEQYIIALDSSSDRPIGNYRKIDEKSDIYSVGATFYHLATGKKMRNYRDQIDYEDLAGRTSEAFAQIIAKAVEKDPNRRFQSAFEMFQAFQNVGKKDARYQALLRRQTGMRIALAVCMAGFIVLGGIGIHTIRVERTQEYNDLVEEQEEYRESGDFEKEEETFEEAVRIRPSSLESYYQNACALYEQGEYQDCISFIEYNVEQNEKIDLMQPRMAALYYLEAESHMELEDYGDAVTTFEKLFQVGGFEEEYYRDYAIALAYNGEPDQAQDALDQAIDLGLKEDSVYYTRGEIDHSLGELDRAVSDFQSCISISEDPELKARAYVTLSDIYGEQGRDQDQRDILAEGRQNVPVENQLILLERLIQADMDLSERTGNSSYTAEAISLLQQVIDQGWDTYDTYDNLVVLCEKQGSYQEARSWLDQMIQKFGEDYNIYKRLAFLEVDLQEEKANSRRDYQAFAGYYQKAKKMYQEQLKGNHTDEEMQLLDHVYQQVLAGGWLS
nr:serine/threonine-protein kinase [uncultured Merdimonas sp.]